MILKQGDSQLGKLTWDPRFNWWEGRLQLSNGESFTLYVETPSKESQSITDKVRRTAATIVKSDPVIRRFAAERLLQTLNESWNDGEPVHEAEFVARMSPSGITIFDDGDSELTYYDDDMFYGHYIEVRYRGGKFTEALISG